MKSRVAWIPVVFALVMLVAMSQPAARNANALVIDFEGKVGSAFAIGTFIDVDGFRFTITATNGAGFEVITNQNDIVEPGTTRLFGANHVEITMTKIGGRAFSLSSLDIGGSFAFSPDRWADRVDVISGAAVTATLAGHGPSYVHLTPNFTNVTSVILDPFVNANQGENNFEFTIDNIVIADVIAVTEPSSLSLALLALGLANLAFARRKRR